MDNDQYKEIKNRPANNKSDPSINELISKLIPYLKLTKQQRTEKSKRLRKKKKEWLDEWMFRLSDESFTKYVGLDASQVKEKKESLKDMKNEWILKQRSSPNKRITMLIEDIIQTLLEFDLSTSKIIGFIYMLFCEYSFDDYGKEYEKGKFPKERIIDENVQKDRIRKKYVEPAFTRFKL